MSSYGTDRRPLTPGGNAQPSKSGDLHSQIDDMLSALPEAPADMAMDETVADPTPPGDLNSAFSQMLTSLPDGPEIDADFDLRPDVSAANHPTPPARPASGSRPSHRDISPVGFGAVRNIPTSSPPPRPVPARPAASRPATPKADAARPAGRSGGATPRYATDGVERPTGVPGSRKPGRAGKPVAERFGRSEDEIADFLSSDEEVTPPARADGAGRRSGARGAVARNASAGGDSPAAVDDSAPLAQRILDELEKYSIAAVTQLRIAVHDGTVTIVGEVPTDYEKKLVMHFAKKVSGVIDVVDMMRIVGGEGLQSGPEVSGAKPSTKAKKAWRPRGPGLQLSFPFQAKHVGIAVGLLAMIYAGFTFATRDGTKLSLNPVSGKVLFEGVPPEGATVVLHSMDEAVPVTPKATVKPDGTVQFWTYLPGDGVPEGEYKLTISWMQLVEVNGDLIAGPNQIPEFLNKPETTTFDVTVNPGKNELPPIQITR